MADQVSPPHHQPIAGATLTLGLFLKPLLLLNRQLSGMYRRTNTLSLNAPASSPLSSTPNISPAVTPALAAEPIATPTSPTLLAAVGGASTSQLPLLPTAAPTKRKLRTSRDPSTPKRAKPSSTSTPTAHAPPTTRLADLGGVDSVIESVLELIALPISHPEVYLHTGVRPPRGVLLVGPPGCGKTMLAGAIAGVSLATFPHFSRMEVLNPTLSGARMPLYFDICPFNRLGHVGRIRKDSPRNVRGSCRAF